jgi:beta-glucosidase
VELAPGETRTVTLAVSASDLAYYDVGSKSWKVEPAEYEVNAGPCARDADLLKAGFSIRQ